MADRVWISWNEQRRNVGLAAAVHAKLYMTDLESPRWLRLCKEFYEAWRIVQRERPSICFTMNPSIFSSWWLSLFTGLYGYRLVTDLHTPNLKLTGIKKKIFQIFFNSGIRRSNVVIVTNNIYRQEVLSLNRNVVIVPDPLPVLKKPLRNTANNYQDPDNKTQILFVSSFAEDEPINEVLALDPELDGFNILVTGNWKKMFASMPATRNIRFLGFVDSDEYDQLLLSVDGVMVLTSEEGCLCCGGYEAFSAGKPMILSQTRALQEFFGEAPVYTQNSSEAILAALKRLKAERDKRAEMVIEQRNMLNRKFDKGIEDFEKTLEGIT